MIEERTKEHIQSNIELLESSLEGLKEDLAIAEKEKDKISIEEYDTNKILQVINDALNCYIDDLEDQIRHTQKVIDREKKKLKEKDDENK